MTQPTPTTPESLEAYWREQINTWEATAQTQKAYCDAHDLNYHRFGYWRRKLLAPLDEGSSHQAGFAQVRRSDPGTSIEQGLRLETPDGWVVHGVTPATLHLVRELIRVLQ